MVGIPSPTEPLAAVRSLAEAAAQQRGASFAGSGLRLFRGQPSPAIDADQEPISAFALGRSYELLLAPIDRQKTGAHLTPESIARSLVALMPAPATTDRVLDPAVGGGAFLLAAADQLTVAGATPKQVLSQLRGVDIDPGAVAVAEASLALWALDHDIDPAPLAGLRQGDGLLSALPEVERIVGNPPFLNQLRSTSSHTAERRAALRERWGDCVSAYTDDAWLFLAAGIDALTDDGCLAMVQPVSILAARHGDKVRHRVAEIAAMQALWVARDRVFDAAVQVCGLVFQKSPAAQRAASKQANVERYVGADFEPCDSFAGQPAPASWGVAASVALGVPAIALDGASRSQATVGDWASATAGFRDQFYGLVPYVSEAGGKPEPEPSPLITVGMIDVFKLHWGERSHRFAGESYERPVIDVAHLRNDDPRLGEWVDARLRPKLVMATQTRVVELWVDESGTAVPATPVLSIEPHDSADEEKLWLLAAALSAPAISAYFVAKNFGTAMSLNAMKVAARDVLAAPLPQHVAPWQAAADQLRSADFDLDLFGSRMNDAFGVTSSAVLPWWIARVPNRTNV